LSSVFFTFLSISFGAQLFPIHSKVYGLLI